MRETYSTLLQQAQDLCADATSSSTTSLSSSDVFLARNINSTVQYIHTLIKNYKTQPIPRTFSTVAAQTFYHYPPGLLTIDNLTVAMSDTMNHPLQVVNSQEIWNRLLEYPMTGDFPRYFFPRQSDFGIWPTPNTVRTGTLVGNFLPQQMTIADYTTGTVTVAQNSLTITGSGTVFTNDMIGRWFCQTDSAGLAIGNWYRISGFTSTTALSIESYFEELSLSGSTYVIAQSPEIPEELHEFIPYRAAAAYFRGPRRDAARAQQYMNYFYTGDDGNPRRGGGIKGGVLGILNEYMNKGRANSQINTIHRTYEGYIPEAWRTTLTEAS